MSFHCTIEDIELYLKGNLEEPRLSIVRRHVRCCDLCRSQVEECLENEEVAVQIVRATRGTSETRPPVDAVPVRDGEPIQGYHVVRELHRGGQGVVYEAIQKATRRTVALKVIAGGFSAGQTARRRFEREIELAAGLRHPNIVTIHDSGATSTNYYLVMDFIDGRRLDRYLARAGLPLRNKIALFAKICDAVNFAHQKGVIHRDLKPSNILVNSDAEPFILDFGLARRLDSEETTTLSLDGRLLGTPQYMAPEQAEGRISEVDVRTDVYALGVILYEMLTGTHPYPVTGRMTAVLTNIVSAEPVRPSRLLRHLDSDLEVIVLKALAKDPDHRYQSVAELHQDIQFWLQGLPIVARSVSSVYVLRKLIVRHRYVSSLVGLMLVIVLAFAYISFDLYQDAQAARVESDMARKKLADEMSSFLGQRNAIQLGALLTAWHAGQGLDMVRSRSCLADTSQTRAVDFLMSPRPIAEAERVFRGELGPTRQGLADFVVGERYLKQGDRRRALEAYKKSLARLSSTDDDVWVRPLVSRRLSELAASASQPAAPMRAK